MSATIESITHDAFTREGHKWAQSHNHEWEWYTSAGCEVGLIGSDNDPILGVKFHYGMFSGDTAEPVELCGKYRRVAVTTDGNRSEIRHDDDVTGLVWLPNIPRPFTAYDYVVLVDNEVSAMSWLQQGYFPVCSPHPGFSLDDWKALISLTDSLGSDLVVDHSDKTLVHTAYSHGFEKVCVPGASDDDFTLLSKSQAILYAWDAPILDKVKAPAPSAPVDELRKLGFTEFANYCEGIAEEIEVPVESVFALCMAVPGMAVMRKCIVQTSGNHTVTPNQYRAVFASPSERKTSTLKAVMRPVESVNIETRKSNESAAEANATRMQVLDGRIKNLYKAAVKKDATDADVRALESAQQQLKELAAQIKPVLRIATNTTGEGLLAYLTRPESSQQCVISDSEGRLFEIVFAGAYSNGAAPDRDLFLKAWDATDASVMRGKADSVQGEVKSPVMTILSFVQPSMLDYFFQDPKLIDNGLLSRFCLKVLTQSKVGERTHSAPRCNPGFVDWWHDQITGAMKANPEQPVLNISPESRELHREFVLKIEPHLKEGVGKYSQMGGLVSRWAAKADSHLWKNAIALHVIRHGGDYMNQTMCAATMKAAIAVTNMDFQDTMYLATMHDDTDADCLIKKSRDWMVKWASKKYGKQAIDRQFSQSELSSAGLHSVCNKNTHVMNDVLDTLEQQNAIKRVNADNGKGKAMITINPRLLLDGGAA